MERMRMRPNCVVLLLLALACANQDTPPPATPDPIHTEATPQPVRETARQRFSGRFDSLTTKLAASLDQYHVPGMAVAVVYEDSVIYAKGFGFSDLEQRTPVTPKTRFAIGSATKAFTATAIGQLVDEGKIGWDDPLSKHVPEFVLKVQSDESAARATIRDALCHRTGFTRMSVLWASGEVPRRQFLAQASQAEPLAPFRKSFLYNNVTYTAAGEASARVEGVMWAELVTRNILEPLGMRNTVVLADEAKKLGLAQGYKWNQDLSTFEALPMRSLDEIAPAGAINSTALDMTAWLRFQINRGVSRGQRLIKTRTLKETWTPQIDVAPSMKYGLGWFVQDYNGQTMLQHGGNIDGYSSMVAFLPEEKLGVVMLSNVSFSGMQDAVRGLVFDTLLEEPDATGGGDEAREDLSIYEGEYVAGFGPFEGKSFTVSSREGVLYVDVPGQQNYELQPPGEGGKRSFVLTDTIAVRFEKERKAVNVMHLYQGGFDFELFREGYVPPVEVPLDAVKPLIGAYEHAALGRAKVLVRNNRLAIDVPNQMIYELYPPDELGLWRFRVKDSIAIEFVPKMAPTKVLLHQGGKTFELVRLADDVATGPTVQSLAKLRRSDKSARVLSSVGIVRMRGDIRFVQAGVEGSYTAWIDPAGKRVRTQIELGKFGWIDTMVSAANGWEASAFSPTEQIMGPRLAQAVALNPLAFAGPLRGSFDAVTVEGSVENGRQVELSLSQADLPDVAAFVDAATGDVVRTAYGALWSGPGTLETEEVFSKIRPALGLRLPHQIERTTKSSGTIRLSNIAYDQVAEHATLFPAEPPPRDEGPAQH